MNPSNRQWDQIRGDYLSKIKAALQGASEHERQQILDEVAVHLDCRFEELGFDGQTWENMQAVIADMGPVDDYAALLEERSGLTKPVNRRSMVIWVSGCILLAGLLGLLGATGYIQWNKHAQSQCPVVVQTTPQTLDRAVSPNTTEISVTFDKPMKNLSWSWVGNGEHFPEIIGEIRYDKERLTCTLPVKLQPGHWYAIGINGQKFVNFQTEEGLPATPYVILFATADEQGNPTKIPEAYMEEARRINSLDCSGN